MDPSLEVYYTVERSTTLFHAADSSRPYLNLRFREPVYVLENGGDWALV
ncbi:MAG: hypothetical protein HKN17_05740, partial [Rhodothermales bacterium]|nr:hypothetical protein [Rhodothermales bacterium]